MSFTKSKKLFCLIIFSLFLIIISFFIMNFVTNHSNQDFFQKVNFLNIKNLFKKKSQNNFNFAKYKTAQEVEEALLLLHPLNSDSSALIDTLEQSGAEVYVNFIDVAKLIEILEKVKSYEAIKYMKYLAETTKKKQFNIGKNEIYSIFFVEENHEIKSAYKISSSFSDDHKIKYLSVINPN